MPEGLHCKTTVAGPFTPEARERILEEASGRIKGMTTDAAQIEMGLSAYRKELGNVFLMTKVMDGEKEAGHIQFKLHPETRTGIADVFMVAPEHQGKGLARTLHANTLKVCDHLGIDKLHMQFDVGDVYVKGAAGMELLGKDITKNGLYTMLRFGATPNDWDGLRSDIRQDFEKIRHSVNDPHAISAVETALASSDAKAAWAIADCHAPVIIEGHTTTLGKALLVGRTAEGHMEITPGSAGRNRFEQYMQSGKSSIHAAQNNVARTLESVGADAERTASKMSGKTKWIIGGIAAGTVLLGAVIALNKKKNFAEREQERRQGNTAAQGIV